MLEMQIQPTSQNYSAVGFLIFWSLLGIQHVDSEFLVLESQNGGAMWSWRPFCIFSNVKFRIGFTDSKSH